MWELTEDISKIIYELNYIAKGYGCMIGLYGSVLTHGKSNHDLDLVIFPHVDTSDEEKLIDKICLIFHCYLIEKYEGIKTNSYVLGFDKNRIIDISIIK